MLFVILKSGSKNEFVGFFTTFVEKCCKKWYMKNEIRGSKNVFFALLLPSLMFFLYLVFSFSRYLVLSLFIRLLSILRLQFVLIKHISVTLCR